MNRCSPKRTTLNRSKAARHSLRIKLERVKGIEPSFSAWEADVLPLNYTRKLGNYTNSTVGRSHESRSHGRGIVCVRWI